MSHRCSCRVDPWLSPYNEEGGGGAPRMSMLSRWELAAETIAVKIRWFGLLFGYALANLGDVRPHQGILNALLALGVGYALLDTAHSWRGRVFLGRWPLVISSMEALFIPLLC